VRAPARDPGTRDRHPDPTPEDALNGPGRFGDPAAAPVAYQGRCGYGPRLPLLLSPYARADFVDHTLTDQTSILRFIEDNWSTDRIDFTGPAQPALALDPRTGNPR
jgi:phospholipase C